MIDVNATTSRLDLVTAGPVPGWLGVLLLITAIVLVMLPLRREFKGVKPTRLTRWVLPGLRLAIVTLIVWLLCQPVLVIVKRWTPPPEVMLVVDSANSMRVSESAGSVSQQLDSLEAVGEQPLAKRNNAASRTARASAAVGLAASTAFTALQADLDAVSTGLPLGPSVGHKLETLTAEFQKQSAVLATARAELPADPGDKELKQSLTSLVSSSQLIGAAVDTLVADAAVVTREASKTPSLLDTFRTRLKQLATDADAARKLASLVQEKLDKTGLTEKDLETLRAKPITRQSLAEAAAKRLIAPHAGGPTWIPTSSPAISAALDDAFRKTLASPLAAVVVISDGGSPLPGNAADSPLAKLKLPVSTILVGADGVEPADAGLVAIDVPRLALAGDPVNVRCLVKNLVTTTPAPKLTLTVGKETIATRDLPITQDGYDVIEFAWTPTTAGRQQLVVRIESASPDAYPGNENSAAVVDVIASKARALIVSDRLTADFAAVSQMLSAIPAVEQRSLLAAPGLSKFHTGSKADEFPATADDFKSLSLLVLIGDVPEGVDDAVITALKQAVESGLRVWVQASTKTSGSAATTAPAAKSWASVLGIETKPIGGAQTIVPIDGLWLDLYQLGKDADESALAWKTLPTASGLSTVVTPGVPLLNADQSPVLQIVRRGSGAVVVWGVSDFSALRSPASSASVNRMLAESLTLGLVPLNEPGLTGGVFPAQPVSNHDGYVFSDAGAAAPPMKVGDAPTVTAQVGGTAVTRVVRRLAGREDFQLAAHAAPLEKIADATGGRHRDLLSMMEALPQGLAGTPRSLTTRLPFWPGPWSLIVLLGLVSAEYLLRRRAGKVM
jgi:hypothetical protein